MVGTAPSFTLPCTLLLLLASFLPITERKVGTIFRKLWPNKKWHAEQTFSSQLLFLLCFRVASLPPSLPPGWDRDEISALQYSARCLSHVSAEVLILGTGVRCLFKATTEDDPGKWSRVLGRPNLNQNLLSRPTNAVGGCPSFRFYLIARKEGRKQKGFPIRSALGRGILAACTFPLEGTPPLMGNAKTHRESRATHPLVLSRVTLAIRTVACLTVYRGPVSPAFEPSDLGKTVSLF